METSVFVIITKSAPRAAITLIGRQYCTHGHRFALNATHFGFSIIIPEYEESGEFYVNILIEAIPLGAYRHANTRNRAMRNTPCTAHSPPCSYASSFLRRAIPPLPSHIRDASSPERAASHSPASSPV